MRILFLEIKKLLLIKRNRILILTGLIFSVIMGILPIQYEHIAYSDNNGNRVELSGMDAVRYKKSVRSPYNGAVTAEKLENALSQYQQTVEELNGITMDSEEYPLDVYTEVVLPVYPLLRVLPEAYADPDTGYTAGLESIPLDKIDNFYNQAEQHITDVIKMEYENSGDIINSATPLYQKISKPYEYYSGISSDAIDYIGFHLLILLLICVAISAPAFSENYENGSDQIFRCTKYGRTHLVLYKLISLFVVLSVFYFICTGIQISILNTAFGTESLKTSVQMLISVFSLASMNIGQLEAAVIMGGFLSILCSICFVSFLSSFIRTGMVTMLGAIILSLLPSILSGIVGIVWPVLAFPSSGIGLKNSLLYQFIDTSFVSFGHHGVWTPYAILFFTIIELPVFFLLSIRFYNRHQVR